MAAAAGPAPGTVALDNPLLSTLPATTPPPTQGQQPAFPIFETAPESITWHKIWDYELDTMTNVSRPLVLGLATMFIGAALGLVPSVKDVFTASGTTGALGWADLLIVGLAGACAAFGLAFGAFAVQGQLVALKVKGAVRARKSRQINSTTPTEGSPSAGEAA